MDALLPLAYGFALVLFRTAALFAVAPIFGAKTVPARVRLALSLAVALVAFSGTGAPRTPLPSTFLDLALVSGAETLVGLLGGFAARAVLEAAVSAGSIAGQAMGLGYGALINPASGAESTALGQILSMVALGLGIAGGLHQEAIRWLCRSLVDFPPGTVRDLSGFAGAAIGQSIYAVALAVRLAFPVLVAVLLGHAVLGAAGRVAPQLNLGSMGFSVAVLAGGGAVYLTAPAAAELAARAAIAAFGRA